MRTTLKRQWQSFLRARPGERFGLRYRASRRGRDGRSSWSRVAVFAGALICVLIGVVLVFIPGPAVLFFLFAGGLLAGESRVVAGALDRGEVALRRAAHRAKLQWSRASWLTRAACILVAVTIALTAAWLSWNVLFSR